MRFGGAKRDRTADLLHAMQALSQLSYSPEPKKPSDVLDGRHNMKPPSGCQRQNQKLRLIAEKGGKSRIALFSAALFRAKAEDDQCDVVRRLACRVRLNYG